ncbi:NADH-quinone oxidoreductase subunit J [Gammaproteobacteria bacterium]|nr:NADH-quinone oxidoreductase subunit J [Gammaproteobacteria bacterium]
MVLKILFYGFALLLLYAAIRVITAKNPVNAVMHLILAFVASSGLWILIQAEFLALVLVIVYVGAVMVLFLFVVMMLDINVDTVREGFVKYLPFGIGIGVLILVELFFILGNKDGLFGAINFPLPPNALEGYSNTRELGLKLYTEFLYPFEIAAVILLVAMIAAISLTHRRVRENNKTIPVPDQLKVSKQDRIRIISMGTSVLESYQDVSLATDR